MSSKRFLVTTCAFTALALNGLTFTFIGASLPKVQADLMMSIATASIVMAFLQLGFSLFSLIAGILSDCIRSERILMIGCLLLGAGSFFFGLHTSHALNMIVALLMGAGLGCILSGSNTLLINLYPERKGAILNIHHVFFGVGSLLGPVMSSYLIHRELGWRPGFIGTTLFLVFLGGCFLIAGGQVPQRESNSAFKENVVQLFRDYQFVIILIVNTLAVGTQVAILLLGVTFLVEAKGSSLGMAGSALSFFALNMMIGRVICSRLTVITSHSFIVIVLLWLQVLCLVGAGLGTIWLAVVSLALSGMTISGVYPTSLALCGILFPEVKGSALGILTTMGGFGSMVLCWLIGQIAEVAGMSYGFFTLFLACVCALFVFQLNYRSLCTRELGITSK